MPSSSLPASRRRAGFTMVELSISMVVLLVAVGGTLSSISSTAVLGDSARETTLAYLEAQRTLERLRGEEFGQLFALYNDDPADDPAGNATASGAGFAVGGLGPVEGDADGRVGRILFPVDGAGRLHEDVLFAGRQHDLDADGSIGSADVSGNYVLLPLRVRVEWNGRSGNRYVELQTVLTQP
jgi:prepilin-type N-terminal cleavage/methylation domain-containing protein